METEVLRWFQQVADGVTVTEVSVLESITQPAVSRALTRLEREVGAPLLRRSGRVLRMTRAGAAFKHHVDRLLHSLDDGLAAVNELVDPETGTVTVAFQSSFGGWLVPDLVASFHQLHPDVRFVLHQIRDDLATSVLGGEADLEIGTRRPDDGRVRSHIVDAEPLRLFAPAAHLLGAGAAVELSVVSAEPFVMIRRGSALHEQSRELCRRAGFEPRVDFEADDLAGVRGFVAAGLGVAIVPAPRVGTPEAAAGPAGSAEIADPTATREIRLMWWAERRLLPAAEMFRRHVIDEARRGHIRTVA